MIDVIVKGGELSKGEADGYILRAREKYPDKDIQSIEITVDGEFVELSYQWKTVPFERIRRITGYLVGTLDRFNNSKRAEVADRLKHNLPH